MPATGAKASVLISIYYESPGYTMIPLNRHERLRRPRHPSQECHLAGVDTRCRTTGRGSSTFTCCALEKRYGLRLGQPQPERMFGTRFRGMLVSARLLLIRASPEQLAVSAKHRGEKSLRF